MGFQEGLNYFFLHSDEDANIRIESEINPFYSFPLKKIEKLPSLYSEPSIVPRFLYNVRWVRRNFTSHEIKSPDKKSNWNFGKGARIKHRLVLERQSRNRMISTRYLSLRDIVNPEYSEIEVLHEIEKLYFKAQDKNNLFKLVKILYAGKPSEEREIVQNLFSFEKDFAEFLRDRIFHIEILPLIHGVFLQDILTKMDERVIKHGIKYLSPPVLNVIRKSVSKNKFQNIMDSPIKEPEEGESLVDKIESLIFQRFSRKIYYEMGSYLAYKIPTPGRNENKEEVTLINTDTFQWSRSGGELDFLGASNKHIYFLLSSWIEMIRFDILINMREWESHEFFRLPPGLILRVPFYQTSRCVIAGGITKSKENFEFYLSPWEF